MNYIDAHVHVWTNDFKRYPLAPDDPGRGMDVPHYGPETILAEARPHGVTRVVLIQMSFYGYDNAYMLDTIAAQPGVFRGVAVIDHSAADVAGTMRRLKSRGVRGFRVYGLGNGLDHWLDHPGYEVMFRRGAEDRMAVCPLLEPAALPALSRMCERFPDTTVVIDHLARIGSGSPALTQQLDALCGLARHKNVRVKVSAFYGLSAGKEPYNDMAPLIRRVYEAYGPQRLMWASDCPYQSLRGSYADSISLVRDRLEFLSPEDKRWLLSGTAEGVFFT